MTLHWSEIAIIVVGVLFVTTLISIGVEISGTDVFDGDMIIKT